MGPAWTHLIRFIAEETGQVHLGQIDVNEYPDVGLASVDGKRICAKEINGSIYDGIVTDRELTVKQVRMPIFQTLIKSYSLRYPRTRLKLYGVSG
jgi:hypothetical protein